MFQNRVPTNRKQETQNEKSKRKMRIKTIHTNSAAKPLGAYPHARKAGNLLFLSGIGSRQPFDNKIPGLELDAEGNILKYDIEAECHSVFANVKAVLKPAAAVGIKY